MDKYAKAFVKASLIYLGIGVLMGIEMLLWPDVKFTHGRVHVHLLLLGFMAMMIYGVGYHILPRFMGRPVYPVRKPRCLPRVKLHFYRGLQRGWR